MISIFKEFVPATVALPACRRRLSALPMAGVLVLLSTCCALAGVSHLMQKAAAPPLLPPTGKSMIIFNRVSGGGLLKLYATLWDGTNFIADIGFNQSCSYVCDPGTHYFINKSMERSGVVQAELLPDRTYGLQLIEPTDTALRGSSQFKLIPKLRFQRIYPDLIRAKNWVAPGSDIAGYVVAEQTNIQLIIHDFVHGEKTNRLYHLDSEDHLWVFPDDVKEISMLLCSSNSDDVTQALKALRRPNLPGVEPFILPCLNSSNPGVVRDACRTLAVVGNKDAVPYLEPLLSSNRSSVRKDAQNAITTLNSK